MKIEINRHTRDYITITTDGTDKITPVDIIKAVEEKMGEKTKSLTIRKYHEALHSRNTEETSIELSEKATEEVKRIVEQLQEEKDPEKAKERKETKEKWQKFWGNPKN